MPGTQWIQKRRNLPHTPLPVACYQRKILATRKQFCHWLIRDWISVLKFQRKPRQVLIIYQNINRLNSRYLHLPAFHYVPPYFALIQLFALCKEASSVKNSKAITIISVHFLMRPDGKKYLEVDKSRYHSPGLVTGATGALTRVFAIFDSSPIKLNQPWMHSPLILPFISLLKTHQWHQTYRSCSSAGAASAAHVSHIPLALLSTARIL